MNDTSDPSSRVDPKDRPSVVLTTYNHAHYLALAIESVLAQSLPAGEIVVVDDGSTDDPGVVVRRYPRVRLIRQENRGLSAARNAGLAATSGDFVLFLDADDALHPHALEVDLDALRKSPESVLAYGGFNYVDNGGRLIKAERVLPPTPDLFGQLLQRNFVQMHGTVLYRRWAIIKAGGFDESLRCCEDYDLYFRLSALGSFAANDVHLADYRRHQENMSGDREAMTATILAVLARQEAKAGTRAEWSRQLQLGRKFHMQKYSGLQLRAFLGAVARREGVGLHARRLVRMVRRARLLFIYEVLWLGGQGIKALLLGRAFKTRG